MTHQKIFSACIVIILLLFVVSESSAQSGTESSCNFGMVKGQPKGSCQVPIPSGCTVAKVPGIDQRWADVSKGGGTTCQFDDKKSNWTTTIIGTCGTCTTDHCSAIFSVMFSCSSTMTEPKMQRPAH